MDLLQLIVLAIVQGITEFLPISSSAHLALAPWFLGWKDQGLTFDIALHVGTLVAVIAYFYKTWVEVIARGFGLRYGDDPLLKQNPALLWYLAAASVPVGVLGFLAKEYAETTLRNPFVIGSMLIGVGLLMWLAERQATCQKGIGEVGFVDSLMVGVAQALAVVPGTSRSGVTMTAALFRGLDRPAAARFSFLLATPAIGGAAAHAFYDLQKQGGIPHGLMVNFAIGIVISGLTGCLAIALLIRYLQRNTFYLFIYYRIVFGIIVIALAAFFRPPAE
ncbi:MAG: undecaprenyl-diphosphate phosphatase [Bryobacteraceae bacterium]